jgi:hypothetical protein
MIVFIAGCDKINPFHKKGALARVRNTYLYAKDLEGIYPQKASHDDSILFRQNYISAWIRDQLIYNKAKDVLTAAEKNKDKQMDEYYHTLLRYELEKNEVRANVDTTVTPDEILTYYSQNRKNFELKRNIVKLLYVKLKHNAPHLEQVRSWIKNPGKNTLHRLDEYANEYAVNFSTDTSSWFYFDDITKEVPIIESYDPEQFILHNNYVELKDASYFYFVNVLDHKIKDDVSPLSLEREKIKNIILNIRQVKLAKEFENRIYQEGSEKGIFEIYE